MRSDLLIKASIVGLIVVVGSVFGLPSSTHAEGIIYQLPDDGAWVSFKVSGKAIAPDGAVAVTIEGTQTLRSVGRTTVADKKCRWIEVESDLTFQRKGGPPAGFKEIVKLLIPETHLVKGENPRAHVLKAFKGASAETIEELDVTGKDAGLIQGLDELFHTPLKQVSALTASEVKTKKRNWTCEGSTGKSEENGAVFTTETRIHKDAPFGVVMYRCEKERQGNRRTMEWQLTDLGKDAKSVAANDKESLQGLWQAVELEVSGQKAPAETVKAFQVRIDGDKLVFNPATENRENTYAIDLNAKPKAMDLTPADGPAKGKKLPYAIYNLDGDKLTICLDKEGQSGKRPTEFKTTAGDGFALLTLERVKDGK